MEFKGRTADLELPGASELEQEILPLRCDPTFGMRQSKKEYDRIAEQRNTEWRSEPPSDMSATLAGAYRRARGEEL